MQARLKKILKVSGISLLSILALMIVLPMLFPEKVAGYIKQYANKVINSQLNFSKAKLSFFQHFPTLTLTLYDFSLTGSAPFATDTLAAGKSIGLGINLATILSDSIEVNKVFIDESRFKVLVDKNGNANYNIYKAPEPDLNKPSSDSGSARLNIEGIYLTNCSLFYNDQSLPMTIEASGLNYKGKGDIANNEFDLKSQIDVDKASFSYDNVNYVREKQLHASLVTGINVSSLSFRFDKNDVRINKLPAEFKGSMKIVKDGYDIDLHLISGTTDFANIFSAVPPEYQSWFANTGFSGTSQIRLDMTGNYRAVTGQAPDLSMHMWVKDGMINYSKAPAPFEHFYVGASLQMPSLNTSLLTLDVDSLKFTIDGEATRMNLHTKGLEPMQVKANIDSKLDLGKLYRAIGIPGFDLGGKFAAKATVNGTYGPKSMPILNALISLSNGHIRTPFYPAPIEKINMQGRAFCATGNTNDLAVHLQPVSFLFEQEPFEVKADISNLNNIHYNVFAKGKIDIANIYKVFALKEYKITGLLQADLHLKGTQQAAMAGQYSQLDNSGTLSLSNGSILTAMYPYPFHIPSAHLKFDKQKAMVSNTLLRFKNNELKLTGWIENYIGYALLGATLKGSLGLQSDLLRPEDFMPAEDSSSHNNTQGNVASSSVIQLPKDLDLSLTAQVKKIEYQQLNISNFSGVTSLQNGTLLLKQTQMDLAGVHFLFKGMYAPENSKSAAFSFDVKADSFDVKKAYNEIPMFREMASATKSAEGLISLDYSLQGMLNNEMMPVYPSIKGKGTLTLENVKMKGMRLFNAVSKATGRDSLSNPNLKKVIIRSSIANNIVTIERTKMKVFGFRPRIEGQTSLDGKLNLKFRLGLPPFGIIGIPMTITGTAENPKIRMRRGTVEDELKPEEIDEDDN